VKPGIHALPAERTVDVRCIAGDKDASGAKLPGLAMMDAEVAAPYERTRIDAGGRPLAKESTHHVEGRCGAVGALDGCHDAAARRTHGEDGKRAGWMWAEVQRICQPFAGHYIGEHKRYVVLLSLKRQVQRMADRAVRTVAADHEAGGDLRCLSVVLERDADTTVALLFH